MKCGISDKGLRRIAQALPSGETQDPNVEGAGNEAFGGFNQWVQVLVDFRDQYKASMEAGGQPTQAVIDAQQQVWDALEALGPAIEAAQAELASSAPESGGGFFSNLFG